MDEHQYQLVIEQLELQRQAIRDFGELLSKPQPPAKITDASVWLLAASSIEGVDRADHADWFLKEFRKRFPNDQR